MKRAIVVLLTLAALVGVIYLGVRAYNNRSELSASEAEDFVRRVTKRCPRPDRATDDVNCTLTRGEWLCTYNGGSSQLSFDDEHPEVSLIC